MFNILKINSKAPNFDITGSQNNTINQYKLSDFEEKWTILFFYSGNFMDFCDKQLVEFQNNLKEFEQLNTTVLSCSTDSPHSHIAFSNILGGIEYPMLSDIHHSVCIDYNVFVDETATALPSIFIINQGGILKWYQVSDEKTSFSMQEILRILKVLQS